MKPSIKWTGLAVAVLLLLGVCFVAVGGLLADRKAARQVSVPKHAAMFYLDDVYSIERGKYLFDSRGCAECHGANGAGKTFLDDGKGMLAHAPNITPGMGSMVAQYGPLDWERTIRHGVKPDGRPLLMMPSEDYSRLTDDDLTVLIAYVRHLPPAAGEAPRIELPAVFRALYGWGVIKDAAAKIDHGLAPPQPVVAAVTVEHGHYVASMCMGCHGPGLSGGRIADGSPDWPPAANLTPGDGSVMPRYEKLEAFAEMFRTGKRPDGTAVSTAMPFESLKQLNDTDIGALHLYLKTLPPRPAGQH